MIRFLLVISILLLSVSFVHSQKSVPLLERKVSIDANNEPITAVLNRIGQAGGFSFSYNSAIISSDQNTSVHVQEKSIRETLNEIFKGSMIYKEKGSYLIIAKAPVPVVKNNVVVILINGYIEDGETKEKITAASVYEKNTITSAVSDEFGYFKLKLEKKTDSVLLSVSKKNYRDTLVSITAPDNQYLTISLSRVQHDSISNTTRVDTVEVVEKQAEDFNILYEDEPNVQNIRDTLHRLVQVSFLPFFGTNERLSGNVINDYSINFLGGYSMGTRQIELGFLVNMDRADVSWLQLAGFGNLVGRHVYGIQGAGFFNVNGGETKAVQLAGFANTNFGETIGLQIAGFANTNLKGTHGVQIAGFSNLSGGVSQGVQVAGFGNVQLKDFLGSQIAGVTNFAGGYVHGSQVSALFNFAKKVKGTQIGLINYADSLGGVPLGLFSFVKSGYHKIELSADEVFPANLAFRTGVRKFYTILQAGFKPSKSFAPSDTSVWTFGYGLGTARKLAKGIYLNLDVTSQHINKGGFTNSLSLLNKMHIGVDFQLSKNFSLYAGGTLNGYLTKNTFTEYPVLFTDLNPNMFMNRDYNQTNLKLWWGAKVGLRFL